jgi:hypothetical protein
MAMLLASGFYLLTQVGLNNVTFTGLLWLAIAFTLASVTLASGSSNTLGIAALVFSLLIFANVCLGFHVFGLSIFEY